MSVYYADDVVTLHFGDAREILPLAADAAIIDPPYAVNDDGEMLGFVTPNLNDKGTHSRGYADHDPEAFAALLDPLFAGVVASLPASALVVTFYGNRASHEVIAAGVRAGLESVDQLVFEHAPLFGARSPSMLAPAHESAQLLRMPGTPIKHNPTRQRGNVYHIPKPRRAEAEHLTPKPLAWIAALVEDFTTPGQVILDPTAGSGTLGVAARLLGRRAVLIEKDEVACEVAARRLSQQSFDFEELAG